MKSVIFWNAVASPQRDKAGNPIPDKYQGAFRTKVAEGTPGAFRYTGETPAAKWDYWALEASVIRGYIRWVDKVLPDFDGATAQIAIWMESDKYLHKVTIPYSAQSMRDMFNRIKRLGKGVATDFLNLQYWVREAVDKNGNVKMNDKGKPNIAKTIQFKDVDPFFSYEDWQKEVEDKNLRWEQRTLPDGKKYWDTSAELAYWDRVLVACQKYLLTTETVLPFTYGSLTACAAANPSGGGNLSADEIEKCRGIYEAKKSEYRMPFGREEKNADDVLDFRTSDEPIPPAIHADPFPTFEGPSQSGPSRYDDPVTQSELVEIDDLPF